MSVGDQRSTNAWLRMIRAPGIGARNLQDLLDRHGDIDAVEQAVRRDARALKLEAAADWLREVDPALMAADRAWLDRPDRRLLTWQDDDYPTLLRESPWPPMALFVQGDPGLLWQPQIAIVGSRNPTAGGRDNARAFARALARSGLTVTSGLAGGVDAAAHEGTLEAGQPTIAVVGTGVDIVYPPTNAVLVERIAAQGAIVSEYPPGTPARAGHFPQRNRIIAGLSLGVVVIEAAMRSGSLITARLAGECGREIFALPGSIHNPMARGCHRLIRQGAKLVETADEIVEELRPLALALGERMRGLLAAPGDEDSARTQSRHAVAQGDDDPDYARVRQALGHDPVAIDELVVRTGLPVSTLSSMLMRMELAGQVTRSDNGCYARSVG